MLGHRGPLFYFLKNILFIFTEKGREGERQGDTHQYERKYERNIDRLPLKCTPTGD